ncbi:MAG: ABC transporter ATP-binding protein [Bacteroidales bacterium]|nr:ABC transporter ATP-binding protein [Bacteroidales bacterium]
MQIIQLQNIDFSYSGKAVLEDFNISFEKNSLTCLLGSSACGKTTILRIIAGFEAPQKGSVLIENKKVSAQGKIIIPPHKRNLAYIFQDLALWPHFSVYKNIAFGLQERKAKNIKEKVFEMLDFFNLSEHANKFPHQLSGGQKQLTAIARALVLRPRILLMDEPLNNLDVKLKHKMLEHIIRLKEKFELSILYVSHDHKEAFTLADNVIVLNKGKIEAEGTVADIKNAKNEFVQYFLEY